MRFRRKRQEQEAAELNITAFMNLMVILVPFLLITAVFSRMTVLELNLPGPLSEESSADEPVDLQLQLVVTDDFLLLRDANIGVISKLDHTKEDYPWETLRETLITLKQRFPEETAIALLLDSSVSYDTMIRVMDRVASTEQVRLGTIERVELFPDISLGDAPAMQEDAA